MRPGIVWTERHRRGKQTGFGSGELSVNQHFRELYRTGGRAFGTQLYIKRIVP